MLLVITLTNYITFDDFKKMDLRVGKVLLAEDVHGTQNLIKLIVDLGTEKRQIIAGIKRWYKPEELEGKYIILVANLEPRKIRGLESQGMLLATIDTEKPILLTVEEEVPPGSKIG